MRNILLVKDRGNEAHYHHKLKSHTILLVPLLFTSKTLLLLILLNFHNICRTDMESRYILGCLSNTGGLGIFRPKSTIDKSGKGLKSGFSY